MRELLTLCGYKESELESELPRVRKALEKLEISHVDIEWGKQRLATYYDIELEGVRKVFRLCFRELVDSLLLNEEPTKKIIYGFMTPGMDIIGSVLVTKSSEVFSIHHSWAFHIVVGCIFDKINPVIEAAEKKWLKAGLVSHCANVKSILGPFALGLIPRPDLLITTGFLCETSPKTLDLLHELYDIPVSYIDTCQDRDVKNYDEATRRTAGLAAKSLRSLGERIQEIVGFKITDEMLWEVLDAKGKLDEALGRLQRLIENSDPLVLSPTHENIWNCLKTLTLSVDGISEAIDAINILYEELRERINNGQGVVDKGSPRVLAIFPAGQTDPRLEHLACEVGIAIVGSDSNFHVPFEDKSDDPYIKFGTIVLQHSFGTSLSRRIPLIIEGCKKLNIDGVLNRFHVGCRSVAADALIIQEAVKRDMGIPVLLLEWESFDPRVYNHEKYKGRLEVFKAMMEKPA